MAPDMLARSRNHASLQEIAAGAVAKARRTLATVRAADNEWRTLYGDVTEAAAMVDAGDALPALGRQWCPSPEAGYSVTWGDVLEVLAGMVGTDVDGEWLREAMAAWLEYDRNGGHDSPGRRLTLPGAIARREGWTVKDAGYHSSRRAVLRALDSLAAMAGDYDSLGYPVGLGYGYPVPLDLDDVLRAMADRPGESVPHGRNSVQISNGTGAHEAQPWESIVMVRVSLDVLGYPASLGYGAPVESPTVPRLMTEAEATRVDAPTGGAVGRTVAPEFCEDPRTAFPGETVHLPSRKVAPSPRKRGGSGSTGPTVPAHLSR